MMEGKNVKDPSRESVKEPSEVQLKDPAVSSSPPVPTIFIPAKSEEQQGARAVGLKQGAGPVTGLLPVTPYSPHPPPRPERRQGDQVKLDPSTPF